jgi:hypothetical protein
MRLTGKDVWGSYREGGLVERTVRPEDKPALRERGRAGGLASRPGTTRYFDGLSRALP